MLCCISTNKRSHVECDNVGLIHSLFENVYTSFLMKKPIRIGILVIFIAMFIVHVAVFPNIEVGLDQKLSMPEDSYVLKYFQVIRVETI